MAKLLYIMAFNESHPIRAKITLNWKSKYKPLKRKFENNLRNNCEIYSDVRHKNAILKLMNIESEFFGNYDLVGKIGHTAQFSYIIMETIGDDTRTSFDLFNNKDHIKEHVKFIKKILIKTIKENKKFDLIMWFNCCKWKEFFSISTVNFNKLGLVDSMKETTPLLLAWFIAPITKFLIIYLNTKNNLSNGNLTNHVGITNSIQATISQTTLTDVAISIFAIVVIFFIVSLVRWGLKENVIKL